MDPVTISNALAMKANRSWAAGERRTTPTGEPLKGFNAKTYWCSDSIRRDGFDLAESLASHLDALETRRSFLADFVSTGGSIECFVGWFTDGRNTGVVLDWELLGRLAALRIDLALDVYGGEDPQHI